jgi:hypothetical protein
MTHTPGPWFVGERHLLSEGDERGEQYGHTITAVGGTVAEQVLGATFHIATVGANPGDDECEDNVRLIAAAPELLAALHISADALDYAQAQVDSENDVHNLRLRLVQVKRVIAKAEGRTDEE